MPYIKQEDREKLISPNNVGELNYLITCICRDYLYTKGEKYQTYNDLIGVLECAKLELYRRKTALYEDLKILENGDIY